MKNAITVPFHGSTLFVVEHSGQPYTPMKPIVDGMGMDWAAQFTKLKSSRFSSTIAEITMVAEDGKNRLMICMPLRKLAGWLMTIYPNKVKPEIRDRIIQFQNECDDVLWEHWSKKASRSALVDLPATIAPHQQNALQVIVARKSGANGPIRAMLWSRFNNHFRLGSYKQLPAEKFDEAVVYLESIKTAHDPARIPGRDKAYDYPKELLDRDPKGAPSLLSLRELAFYSESSPTLRLLREMHVDGHNVDAPLTEWAATQESLLKADKILRDVVSLVWDRACQPSSLFQPVA